MTMMAATNEMPRRSRDRWTYGQKLRIMNPPPFPEWYALDDVYGGVRATQFRYKVYVATFNTAADGHVIQFGLSEYSTLDLHHRMIWAVGVESPYFYDALYNIMDRLPSHLASVNSFVRDMKSAGSRVWTMQPDGSAKENT